MDNSNEQNIEQLLKEELTKLKKAVDYIEEAKKVAATSTELLEKINNKNNQLEDTKDEISKKFDLIQEQIENIISENNKTIEKKLDALWVSINEESRKNNSKINSEFTKYTSEQIEQKFSKNNKLLDSKLDGLWTSLNNELKNIKNERDSVYESSIALLKKNTTVHLK